MLKDVAQQSVHVTARLVRRYRVKSGARTLATARTLNEVLDLLPSLRGLGWSQLTVRIDFVAEGAS